MPAPPDPLRIIIADDHQLVRQGLRRYLESAEGFEVAGEAGTGSDAVALAAEHRPDVAIVDLRMGDVDGIETTRRIQEASPSTAVVILTGQEEERLVIQAIDAGARGYVLKARNAEQLVQTVRLVAQGNLVIDPELAGAMTKAGTPRRRATNGELTARELEVLTLLSAGKTNRQIAEDLFISPDTVKTHLEHIYQKLGTPDRTAAVAEGLRRQLIS